MSLSDLPRVTRCGVVIEGFGIGQWCLTTRRHNCTYCLEDHRGMRRNDDALLANSGLVHALKPFGYETEKL